MSKPYSAEQLKWFADNNYSITTRSKEDKSKVVSILEMISRFLATITAQAKVIEECKERLHHTFTGGVGVECNKPYSGVCSCGIDELLTAIAKLKEEK